MKKSAIVSMPPFFDRYINLVEDIHITDAFENYAQGFHTDKALLEKLGDKKYAPGKWTVKDILQHIIDNDRVQAYRALLLARNDNTALPGYDEQLFSETSNANNRSVNELLDEFYAVRNSNIALFKSFNNEMLLREGICFNINISVLALGFVIIGHQMHHFNVIKERYYPLL